MWFTLPKRRKHIFLNWKHRKLWILEISFVGQNKWKITNKYKIFASAPPSKSLAYFHNALRPFILNRTLGTFTFIWFQLHSYKGFNIVITLCFQSPCALRSKHDSSGNKENERLKRAHYLNIWLRSLYTLDKIGCFQGGTAIDSLYTLKLRE